MNDSSQMLYTIIISLKLAIFLAIVVQVGLMGMVEKRRKQGFYALGLMAAAFFVVAVAEFLRFLGGGAGWLGVDFNFYLLVNSLYVLASIGIFWYIWEMKTRSKDYR